MNPWFRTYGIPLSALTANLTMIPKGATLRVSLNFNALALAKSNLTNESILMLYTGNIDVARMPFDINHHRMSIFFNTHNTYLLKSI